jgi:thiamine kinase
MSNTIPGLQLAKQALQHIPNLVGAEVVALQSDGSSNRSYRVEYRGESFVLRLDKPETASLGLDRGNEKLISRVVADAGIAPATLCFKPEEGMSFRGFMSGRSWNASDMENPESLARLAIVLQKLHRLEPVGARFEPLAAARRYADQLDSQESYSIVGELKGLAEKIAASSPLQAICHNDLVCQNIFEGDRLMLIDWEYTGVGDPFFDLAVVVKHHELAQDLTIGFLGSYLQHPPTPHDLEHLDLQCQFYAGLLQLWNKLHL